MADFFATQWPLMGIAASAGIILLAQQWRSTLIGLFLNYVFVAAFLAQQQFITPDVSLLGYMVSTTVLVKIIAGLSAVLILGVTALTFSDRKSVV
jgi:hypothetical protein